MSADGLLGERKLRRIREATGLDVVRGWAWGAHQEVVTAEHVHYDYDPATQVATRQQRPRHYTSCDRLP